MLTTMAMPTRSPLVRYSSQDLLDRHAPPASPSPTPPRSNSFVASRRCGIVSEQDAIRLAAASFNGGHDAREADFRRPSDPRLLQKTVSDSATLSPWPAPVLRQRSSDAAVPRRPRPLSTGYLPSSSADSQVPRNGIDSVDPQLRLQNVELLPNRQFMPQQGDGRWRQWNTPQKTGVPTRPDGDLPHTSMTSSPTYDNGWRQSPRSRQSGGRPAAADRQRLEEREAELRCVRSTMESNETAILRAMDDQRRAWETEVAGEREAWARKVHNAEQRTTDVQQQLTNKIQLLELENEALRSANVKSQHSRGHRSNDRVRSQRSSDASTDETSRSRSSLKQSYNGVDGRTRHFTSGSGSSVSDGSSESGASRLASISEGPMIARCLHCEAVKRELERLRRDFDAEREQWLAEKRRVIAYQKLIQSKYVELTRRYTQLEGGSSVKNGLSLVGLNHIVATDDALPSCDNTSRFPRSDFSSGPAQSNGPMFSPRLIPFGQSIET